MFCVKRGAASVYRVMLARPLFPTRLRSTTHAIRARPGSMRPIFWPMARFSSFTFMSPPLENKSPRTELTVGTKSLEFSKRTTNGVVIYRKEGLPSELNPKVKNLIFAIKFKEYEDAKNIIESGISPNDHDSKGEAPLIIASKGNEGGVRFLLQNGANPYITCNKCSRGWTAMHYASFYGYTEVLEVFAEFRVNFNILDKEGNTPLDLSRDRLSYNIIKRSGCVFGDDLTG